VSWSWTRECASSGATESNEVTCLLPSSFARRAAQAVASYLFLAARATSVTVGGNRSVQHRACAREQLAENSLTAGTDTTRLEASVGAD